MEEKIIIGNELIAEFMDCKQVFQDNEKKDYYIPDHNYIREIETGIGMMMDNDCTYYPEDMLYHSDWSWIMPVIEKIETLEITIPKNIMLGFINAPISTVVVTTYYDNREDFKGWGYDISFFNGNTILGIDTKYTSKIEATWNATIAFIIWYNLNQNLTN